MAATLVAVLGALAGNVATSTVVLPPGWTVGLWIAVGVLTVVSVGLAVRQYRAERRTPAESQQPVGVRPQGVRSIAAGGDIGVAVTGDHAAVTVLPAGALASIETVAAPEGLTNLPARPGVFVGREDVLRELDSATNTPAGKAVVVRAVQGLGGIGKSTLAAHWAATHRPQFTVLWWITADTPAGIDSGLAELATAVQPAIGTVLPVEVLREQAVQWLAIHEGWLVVLDNVTDPAHVAPVLARVRTGRFLITSRRSSGWHGIAVPVALGVLHASEAVELLTSILTHHGPRDCAGAERVCAEVGYLPLAIEQIGAYCAESAIIPQAYLALLHQYPEDMLAATATGHADRSIARVWRITLDHLTQLDPLAGKILRIVAWWAPTDIPRTLLDPVAEAPALHRAVGLLATYSMITLDEQHISVHRLVQTLARTPDPDDPHRDPSSISQAREQATTLLDTALPADYRDPQTWPLWRQLLPHVDTLSHHTTPETDTVTTARLLNETALFIDDQGNLAQSHDYRHRAHTTLQRILGDDHPQTLTSRNNLANAYYKAGDLTRAVPLFEQTLTDSQRILGDDHPHTLLSRNNLAYVYEVAGDLTRAVPLFEQTLTDRQRILGDDHPHTLLSRNNLANAYYAAGDLTRAVPLFEQTLTDRQRILGDDHPHTLLSRNNLASAYEAAGDLTRAVPLFEQTLTDSQRILGDDHPQTLTVRNNLAHVYEVAGDLTRAVPLFEQTLTDSQRILGDDHPQTLLSRNNLASAYEVAGDLTRAVPLFEQTLTDSQRILGDDHPQTLLSRNNLASAYEAAGDLTRAVPLFEQTLTDRQRILGDDHPQTLLSRNNLAHVYEAAGDLTRAIPLFEQTLTDSQRILGDDHPHTKIIRANLAAATQQPI